MLNNKLPSTLKVSTELSLNNAVCPLYRCRRQYVVRETCANSGIGYNFIEIFIKRAKQVDGLDNTYEIKKTNNKPHMLSDSCRAPTVA
ncbi:unnamed protein product [Leptosia nina]|uniref:Uncharacterized protein n=1 Tax=Leptosia nina TaxID=320188 RepID=A0AAV1JLA5_9NEOP